MRWENGPDDAADDIGMGCSLSMLIKAAFPELLLGLCDVFAGGICGEECGMGVEMGEIAGKPLNCFKEFKAL